MRALSRITPRYLTTGVGVIGWPSRCKLRLHGGRFRPFRRIASVFCEASSRPSVRRCCRISAKAPLAVPSSKSSSLAVTISARSSA